jgi:hypothetical protein
LCCLFFFDIQILITTLASPNSSSICEGCHFTPVENTCKTTSFHCKGRFVGHKTSSTPPLFIEVPWPSQESEWCCICVVAVYASVAMVFRWYFLLFILIGSGETLSWLQDFKSLKHKKCHLASEVIPCIPLV